MIGILRDQKDDLFLYCLLSFWHWQILHFYSHDYGSCSSIDGAVFFITFTNNNAIYNVNSCKIMKIYYEKLLISAVPSTQSYITNVYLIRFLTNFSKTLDEEKSKLNKYMLILFSDQLADTKNFR